MATGAETAGDEAVGAKAADVEEVGSRETGAA
jgi:hypothetical protein